MSMVSEQCDSLARSRQQPTDEVIKKIRKLRWIGMEAEAHALDRTLCRTSSQGCVLAFPNEID